MISPAGYDLDTSNPAFTAMQKDYALRSKAAVNLPGAKLNVPFGDHPRQKIDIFPTGVNAPVLFFLRGGYWKFGEKEDRRFPASVWRDRGVVWAVPNYRLSPEFHLGDIVVDARNSLLFLHTNVADFGIDPAQIHVVGNSAGAHLTATVAAEQSAPSVASLTLISVLYDLEPLIDVETNTWLSLDQASARRLSPIHTLPPADIPITVCCGGDETDAFKFQTRLLADACRNNGNPVDHFESPGKDHIDIIGETGEPGSPVFEALERVIFKRR